MDDATIRVPVPREFLVRTGWADPGEQVLTVRMGESIPLTLGEFELGDWDVVSVEITTEDEGHGPRLAVVPQYWVTLRRAPR